MKEIEFRGKRIDTGEWERGGFYKNTNDDTHWIITHGDLDEYYSASVVHPETVGQYTGMNDKNGKKIFESDIVKVKIQGGYCDHFADKERILPVKYLEEKACWSPFNVCHMWREEDGTPKAIEVVGNIHDNPELLTA